MAFRLQDDGNNWHVYRIQLYSALEAYGLSRHIRGTIPVVEIARIGMNYYTPWDIYFQWPLTQDQVDRFENYFQQYTTKEALGSAILEESLPPFIYQRLVRRNTLYEKLVALDSMFASSNVYAWKQIQVDMEKVRYEGGLIRRHVCEVLEYRDRLQDYGFVMTDKDYVLALMNSFEGHPWLQAVVDRIARHPGCQDEMGGLYLDMLHQGLFECADRLAYKQNVWT